MNHSTRKQSNIEQIILYFILTVGAVIMLGPFLWMIMSAFKSNTEIIAVPPTLFPEEFTFQNFTDINSRFPFIRYFLNSMTVTIIKTVIVVYLSLLVGTVFAKYRFKWKNVLFMIIMGTMMIPWPVTIIPLYQIMLSFKLIGSYAAIIIPFALNTFGIFFMRQFVSQIPDELMDAARIDGAKEFYIFNKIFIPLSVNAISAFAIFVFLWTWEDFLWPYLMINEPLKYLLPIGLASFSGQYEIDYGGLFAATSLSIIPVIIVYIFFQRQFISGISMTGIK